MDLNHHNAFNAIDQSGMLASILALPSQLKTAYQNGHEWSLDNPADYHAVVIGGMGGSAIAADLLLGCLADTIRVPVAVIRDYHLPAWAQDDNDVLVVTSSHSGNTEETLSLFDRALSSGCGVHAITTGGALAQRAQEAGAGLWRFKHQGQPRAAVGWSFGLLLALFERLDILPSQQAWVASAVEAMRNLREHIKAEIPIAKNPAKRLAGQLVGKYPCVIGAEHLAPVARRWKTQINELAKSWCQYETLPEADHNTLAGTLYPEEALLKIFSIFLQSPHYHDRTQQRVDLTFTEFMVAGIGTDKLALRGETRLEDMWVHLFFGDMLAYYLALLYDIDPTPVEAIESFKAQLG